MKYSTEKSYDSWTDFKRRIINVAVTEINNTPECGMTVSYEPVKSGKGGKVYGITFYVELNSEKNKKKIRNKKYFFNLSSRFLFCSHQRLPRSLSLSLYIRILEVEY